MRTRLSPDQRREQLLTIGMELFAKRAYEDVWIEEVAEIARVSRGLFYHYFPTKRDFFLAILEAESVRLLQLSAPDLSLPLAEQLTTGLDIYLDYAQQYPDGFRVVEQAAKSDEAIRRIKEARLTAQQDRILTTLATMISVNAQTRIAVHSWLAFVPAAIVEWLGNPAVSRMDLRDLCIRTLYAAVGLPPLSAGQAGSGDGSSASVDVDRPS